jgi:predicted transcriptional regulator
MKRSQVELFFEIMSLLYVSPQKSTRIMFLTNINTSIIVKLLKTMQNAGYSTVTPPIIKNPLSLKEGKIRYRYNRIYSLTEEGRKFYLKIEPAMREIKALCNSIDSQTYAEEAQRISKEIDVRLAMQ